MEPSTVTKMALAASASPVLSDHGRCGMVGGGNSATWCGCSPISSSSPSRVYLSPSAYRCFEDCASAHDLDDDGLWLGTSFIGNLSPAGSAASGLDGQDELLHYDRRCRAIAAGDWSFNRPLKASCRLDRHCYWQE